MPVRTQAKKVNVQQWAVGRECIGAVETPKLAFVCGRRLIGRRLLRLNRVDVFAWYTGARKKTVPRQAEIAARMIVRHETLVAPEPVHALPGKARCEIPFRKSAVGNDRCR